MASFTCFLVICIHGECIVPRVGPLHPCYLWNPLLRTPIEFGSYVFNNTYWINHHLLLNYSGLELQQQILAPSSGMSPNRKDEDCWVVDCTKAARGYSNYLDNLGECLLRGALPSFYRPLILDLITKASHLVSKISNIPNPTQITPWYS